MRRGRPVLSLIAMLLPVILSPSFAATPDRMPVPVEGVTFPLSNAGPAGDCDSGDAAQAFQWFFPSDDYYYEFFDTETCGCRFAYVYPRWILFWPQTCSVNAKAFVIPAIETSPGCYVPDHAAAPPDPTNIIGQSEVFPMTGTGTVNHVAPGLPIYMGALTKAFVVFKIVSNIDCPVSGNVLESPAIVVDNSPDPCRSYNGFLGNPPAEIIGTFGFPGNLSMHVTVDCIVPALRPSWGTVKVLYR